MRQGLRDICEAVGGFTVVADASGGVQAVALCRALQPDVILMDLAMPDVSGPEAIRQIMREAPTSRIIALTMYPVESWRREVLRAGVRAYLLKTTDPGDLVAAILAVHRGACLVDRP